MLFSNLSLGLCAIALSLPWVNARAAPAAAISSTTPSATPTLARPPRTTTTTTPKLARPPKTTSTTTSCPSGYTLTSTPDCTYPTVTHTYCYSQPPPLTCPPSSYPSVYHPGHCATESTCFPVSADYLTQSCPPQHGLTTYSVSTVYSGTLAGESTATVITYVQCYCPTTDYYSYYSYTTASGSVVYDSYCLPHTSCAPGMTTSTSTNSYCATEPPESCSGVPLTTKFCQCGPGSTPYYSGGTDSATPAGCRTASH